MQGLRAAAIAVDVGGVEQGDADVERLVDDLAGALEIETRPKLLQPRPTTETRRPEAPRLRISMIKPVVLDARSMWDAR